MEFLKIYRRVKNLFVAPKLKWYFGTWKNEPNLPVWRHGPQIRLAKYHQMYMPNFSTLYSDGVAENGLKKYGISYHELPVKRHTYVWTRRIRKKLKKLHLSWIPPIIQLPIWMTFKIYDDDIVWKPKYDDYRYEFPAHITLIFFGLAISVTAYIPDNENGFTTEDDYWESLLTYNGNLKDTNDQMGWWNSDTEKYFRFNPNFLKEPYKSELIRIQKENPINNGNK